MNKIFKNSIGYNMKVYVDDMFVKSNKASLHIDDLVKTFNILKRHQLKLNLTKSTFDVTLEKFFSFMLTRQGIEANLKKIKAILNMKPSIFQ